MTGISNYYTMPEQSKASNEDYSKVPEDFTITKGQAALRHYANQPAHPLCPLRRHPNFTSTYHGVNACLA